MSKLGHSNDETMREIDERRAQEDGEVPLWKRVYQGGHHDVWCNGEMHRKTIGGWCHPDNEEVPPLGLNFKCDCAFWRQHP